MRTIHRNVVAAMIFSKEGKLLMAQKSPQSSGAYVGKWHLPGGGVEENETREEATVREISEELGLDITTYKLKLVDNEGRGSYEKILKETNERVIAEMDFTIYKVNIIDKESTEINITLSPEELSEYRWFEISELGNIELPEPSIILFEKLGYLK